MNGMKERERESERESACEKRRKEVIKEEQGFLEREKSKEKTIGRKRKRGLGSEGEDCRKKETKVTTKGVNK